MVEVSYPGVYIQELQPASQPFGAASTSRAVFVGATEMGVANKARLISSWDEYQRAFGGFGAKYLPHSVFQYFNNGGRSCYVLRVAGEGATSAAVGLPSTGSTLITLTAAGPGSWGQEIATKLEAGTRDPENEAKLKVWRGNPDTWRETDPPTESFDDLSFDPNSSRYIETVIAQGSSLLSALVTPGSLVPAPAEVEGAPVPATTMDRASGKFRLRLDGDDRRVLVITVAQPPDTGSAFLGRLSAALTGHSVTASPVESGQNRSLKLSHSGAEVKSIEVLPASGPSADVAASQQFLNAIGFGLGASVKHRSPFRNRRPSLPQQGWLTGGTPASHAAPTSAFSVGSTKAELDRITDASLLVLPGLTGAAVDEAISYCANRPLRDMFVIADCALPPPSGDVVGAVKSEAGAHPRSEMGAIYFPWVLARDPAGGSAPIALPPSGFVAGIYARTDRDRGVWTAPAGLSAGLVGALGLTHYLTDGEQGDLNLRNVNVLRKFDEAGLVVWGARTLASDSSQKYVPVRRLQSMIQRSVYNGLQRAVFQPNGPNLWASLKTDVAAFLESLFRAGAFQGSTSSKSYFVRCGLNETMQQSDIDLGMVIVDVGFAPVKPAEFVVVRVQRAVNTN
jgi:phage tail sheath protein FI